MINNEYSFFTLTSLNSFSMIYNDSSIELENKIWKLVPNKKNSIGANVFKLFWIDLLNYNNKKIYGQIDEVELWCVNDTSILVFTSSFSIVNLVRHFLSVELKLTTKINSYKKDNLLHILNINVSSSLFIMESGNIIKINADGFNKTNLSKIFAVEYFDSDNKILVFVSIHGMVKLSYGASELAIKKVCGELGIRI